MARVDSPRVRVDSHLDADAPRSLAEDVLDGLTRPAKELAPKYFYDARGSELFDRICELPEYYPTRAERAILEAHADAIIAATGAGELVELGSGTAAKTRLLLDAMARAGTLRRYVPFDVDEQMVHDVAAALAAEYPGLEVHGVAGDFERHLDEIPPPQPGCARVVAFLGGTDDSAGVTAEFNRNVLLVLNRELGADFDPALFDHVAFYDPGHEWIEMRLRAPRAPRPDRRRRPRRRVRARRGASDGDLGEVHTRPGRRRLRGRRPRARRLDDGPAGALRAVAGAAAPVEPRRCDTPAMFGRHTKIVATLGPATDVPGVLDRLVEAGLDCARLNCSHGTPEDLRRRAAAVRSAAERAQRSLGLLFDLQGPKLRLSAETGTRMLRVGETVIFGDSEGADEPGRVRVDFPHFAALVTERSQIVVGDGVPRFAVESVTAGEVVARALSPGPLSARKGVNVTYARPELPAITEKDVADLAVAAELDADFVALSFVRTAADLEELRARMQALSCPARVVAKIEKVEAYERLDEIIGVADGVMVARGDYGVEAGVAHVPLMQKDTIARATQAGKLVITATQMLESMIHAPEPTRAEATDVANAVIDGSSAVMLSAETSVGSYPVEAVQAMAEIAEAAEQAPEIHGRARKVTPDTAAAVVMHAAVELAHDLHADALIVPTATGGAPRACAKYRPRRPIVALAHDRRIADQLTLEWGVHPTPMPVAESVDDMIEGALIATRDSAGLPTGARVVLTAGRQTGTPGATNLIMVREIP